MDEKSYAIQIRHLKNCIASLRLLNLNELQVCAEEHGAEDERDLIAALMLALETLPDDRHP